MSKIKEYIRRHLNNFLGSSVVLKEEKNVLLRHIDYLTNISTRGGHNTKVLYTCICGNYDTLLLHSYIDQSYDYVCFTDSSSLLSYTHYGAWQVRPLVFSELDNTRNNRWHKTHPHILFPEYEESIYIDGNMSILSPYIFEEFAQKNMPLVLPRHWGTDSIYDEVDNVINVIVPDGGERLENVKKMEAFLKEHNMPAHYGMNENNCIYRKHNDPKISMMMEEWWEFIRDYTKRDQLSLSYILYKNGIKPADIAIDNLRKRYSDVQFVCH